MIIFHRNSIESLPIKGEFMKKIVLAFIALNIFDVSGMNARTFWFFNNRRPAPAQPVVRYKLRDLKLMRPPIVFGKIKRLPNSAPVTRTFANEELGNISFPNSMHKSVNLDEFLKALDAIEKSSNSENLNYWEISCKVSLPDNKAELRCLAERNGLKDVYIIGTFPAGFSMDALGLKNDRSYYYSGTGMEQDLYKGFFQSLKDRCPRGDCRIYTGDYDSKDNKLIYDTSLEYPCN